MERKLATAQRIGSHQSAASSLACLLFVLMLSAAFWAGAIWIGDFLLHISALR
jgi:hypothetical protein